MTDEQNAQNDAQRTESVQLDGIPGTLVTTPADSGSFDPLEMVLERTELIDGTDVTVTQTGDVLRVRFGECTTGTAEVRLTVGDLIRAAWDQAAGHGPVKDEDGLIEAADRGDGE